jgi:hypothetical protein
MRNELDKILFARIALARTDEEVEKARRQYQTEKGVVLSAMGLATLLIGAAAVVLAVGSSLQSVVKPLISLVIFYVWNLLFWLYFYEAKKYKVRGSKHNNQ